jgi:hypothetical protein
MDNIEIYKHAKFEFQIPYIQGPTKNDRFWRFESLHCSLLRMSGFIIFYNQYYKVFRVGNLHACRSQHCPYLEKKLDFFENFKMHLKKIKKQATCSSSNIWSFRSVYIHLYWWQVLWNRKSNYYREKIYVNCCSLTVIGRKMDKTREDASI